VAQWVKNLPAMQETQADVCLIPRLGRFSEGRHGNPPQYSSLENPMDRGASWTIVHRVPESDTTEVTEHISSPYFHRSFPKPYHNHFSRTVYSAGNKM